MHYVHCIHVRLSYVINFYFTLLKMQFAWFVDYIDVKNINLQIKTCFLNLYQKFFKNIKTAKKHKNTCFLNFYKNIKNFYIYDFTCDFANNEC